MFKAEWYVRSHRNKSKISFTEREKMLPRIFILLDIIFIVLSVTLFVLKYFGLL